MRTSTAILLEQTVLSLPFQAATSPILGSLIPLVCFFPVRSICVDISSCFGILMAAETLTELEAAIETVVSTFFTFAGREGRKGSLNINEFKELATQQLPHLLKVGRGL